MRVLRLAAREPSAELSSEFGAERLEALRALLDRRARAWAEAAFPDADVVDVDGGLVAALAELPEAGADAPVVMVAPEIATWPGGLGAAVLGDLAAGCALSFGPVFDGGLYLLVLAPPGVALLRDAEAAHDLGGRGALTAIITLAEAAGLQVGMLQTERGLRLPGDVRALRVDPLTDDELRAVLG